MKRTVLTLLASAVLLSGPSWAASWSQISANDRAALTAFYNATNGDSWSNNTGWLDPEEGAPNPHGLNLVQEGEFFRVAGIVFGSSNNLTGNLPEEIGNLSRLEALNLASNNIGGSIPDTIGSLSGLSVLILDGNPLAGAIPESIAKLQNLTNLSIDHTQLSGAIPAGLGSLSSLQFLTLSHNQLIAISPGLASLASMEALDLSNNQISGAIPDIFGSMPSLRILDLSSNQFSGSLPASMASLGQLTDLTLSNNSLSGPLPPFVGQMQNLERIMLSHNAFGDPFPTTITKANLPNLVRIWMDNNHFDTSLGSQTSAAIANLNSAGVRVDHFSQTSPPDAGPIKADHTLDEEDGMTGEGQRSLREAIKIAEKRANEGEGAVTVMIPAGAYDLTRGEIAISIDGGMIELKGDEVVPPIIDAQENGRILKITGSGTVQCSSLWLVNGRSANRANGGAILTEGSGRLELTGCFLGLNRSTSDNQEGGDGGAVCTSGFDLAVHSCQFRNNNAEAEGRGGQICAFNAQVSLQSTSFSETSARFAGHVYAEDSALTVNDCDFSLGHCVEGAGCIFFGGTSGKPIQIANSLFFANVIDLDRGAVLYLDEQGLAPVTLLNTSILLNASRQRNGSIIYNARSGPVTFSHSTIAANLGWGLLGFGTTYDLNHTILSGNRIGIGATDSGFDTLRSMGHNLIGSGVLAEDELAQGDVVSDEPFVGVPVGRAASLLPQSPAVNAGVSGFDSGKLPLDGRGQPRIMEGRIDIGAYEAEFSLTSILGSYFGDDPAPETVALDGDPDADGTSTGIEIATGTHPNERDTPNLPVPTAGSLIMEFQLNERLRDFRYGIQGSGSLGDWADGATFIPQGPGMGYVREAGPESEFVSATQDGAIWTIKERITPSGEDGDRTFGRLSVRVEPEVSFEMVFVEDFESAAAGALPAGWQHTKGANGFAGTTSVEVGDAAGNPGKGLRLAADTSTGSDAAGHTYFITVTSPTISGPLATEDLSKLRLLADLKDPDAANSPILRIESSTSANFASVSGRIQFAASGGAEFTEVGGLLSEGTPVSSYNPADPFHRIVISLNHNFWGFDVNQADWDNIRLEAAQTP